MSLLHRILKLSVLTLAACIVCDSAVAANVSSRISSRFLARGERALLEVAVVGARPTTFPEIAPIEGVKIQPAGTGPQTQLIPGRRVEHIYTYVVSSYEVGTHRIAPIQVQSGQETYVTEALDFSVFNPDELIWSKALADGTEFRYACAFKVLEEQPYLNQAVAVEIKLYVPRDLFVIDWGIPDFNRDGLTCWRMQPMEMRSEINLLGMPYISVAYPSTLTPSRSGDISIGPASIRLISTKVVMDGILKRQAVETQIQVPELKLKAKELPPNAPSGFDNAVGSFQIQLSTDDTEVREGDPIAVEILVSGSGNLDTLRPPQPVSPLGWKVYEASQKQRGDERRELSGNISFQQFLRPLELKSSIPAYRLVFFNPATGNYESIQTEPIALEMTPSLGTTTAPSGPPPALGTPVEQMTDILGLIPNARLTRQPTQNFPQWWIHAFGGIMAASLILRALWIRLRHLMHSDPVRRQQLTELRHLEGIQGSDHAFLMASGRFIERWLGEKTADEINAILKERDEKCFRESHDHVRIEPNRRKDILSTLRRHATSWVIIATCLMMGAGSVRAQSADQLAREAYQSARYDRAIETWLKAAPYSDLSADTLYHIGNACYRAGSPGYAALYYRRALERDSQHLEARQNLRFIERKYGALSIKRPNHQYLLARLPLDAWKTATWAGIWLLALGLLCFPATHRGARLRYLAMTIIIISPLLAMGGGLGWRYFPSDAAFASIEKQAVIVNPKSSLHSEASRNSSVVIETPPGSLCEVLYQSGEWSYVSFATRTRGWLPSANIELITPKETPKIPKITKPDTDETSA